MCHWANQRLHATAESLCEAPWPHAFGRALSFAGQTPRRRRRHIHSSRSAVRLNNTSQRAKPPFETMMWLILLGIAAALCVALNVHWRTSPFYRKARRFPGARSLPFFGDIFHIGFSLDVQFLNMLKIWRQCGSVFRIWFGPIFLVVPVDARDVEIILSNVKFIEKKFPYIYLYPWLGTGLLTSGGAKWHKHRKLITPSFHFKILENFVPVFNSQGERFIEMLHTVVDKGAIDILPFVELYTQDVICETAMGIDIQAQKGDKMSLRYVETVRDQNDLFMQRLMRPWCFVDFIWYLTNFGRRESINLKLLHGNTYDVIGKRKLHTNEIMKSYKSNDANTKVRLAFLDLLLVASQNQEFLSYTDIREEVDTFMFEGHDTTASGVSFTLYEISRNQDVQDLIVEELKSVMGSVLDLSMEKLNQLKYLERVVKEALRLYPSVANISRDIKEDVKLVTEDLTIPAGSTVGISAYVVHRNPIYFPNPEKFDPDNFLPEKCANRHPFAYIPFSAGPRNCIGQKFAMLELKSIVSKAVWHYRFLPAPNFEIKVTSGLTLKSSTGIKMVITKREENSTRYNT